MKWTISLLLVLAQTGTPAFAAVENIFSMQREPGGGFSVFCDNKGVVSQLSNVSADLIRTDQVCSNDVGIVQLEEGAYSTSTDFCGQTVKWNGPQLQLILDAPCAGTLTLDQFQGNWYRGKLAGYAYIYEVQIKGPGQYVFYSRDFGTEGEFAKATSLPSQRAVKAKRHADPARL